MKKKPSYIELEKEVEELKLLLNNQTILSQENSKDDYTKYNSLLKNINHAIIIYKSVNNGQSFIIKDLNQAAESYENLKKKNIIGKEITEVLPNVANSGMLEVLRRVIDKEEAEHFQEKLYKEDKLVEWRDNNIYVSDENEITVIYSDATEKQKGIEDLIHSEQRFRRTFENAPIGIITYNLQGKVYKINKRALQILKSPYIKDLKSFSSLKVKNIGFKDDFASCIDKKDTIINEMEFTSSKNSPNFIKYTLSPISNSKGDVCGVQGVFEDITENKKIINELKTNENQLRALFNSMTEIVFEVDYEGTILYIAPTSANLLHKLPEEVVNKPLHDIFPSETANTFLAFIRDSIDQKETKTIEYPLNFNNDTFWFEGKATPKTDKTVLYIARDITLRKNSQFKLIAAQENIKRSEKKFRDLFEKSSNANLIIENGLFVDCNQATIDMLGYENKQEIINSKPSKLSPEIQEDGQLSSVKANNLINKALKEGSCQFEWIHRKQDGTDFPAEVSLTKIENNKNKSSLHVVWRNITERKNAVNSLKIAKEDAEENERKLHTLIGNLQGVVYRCANDIHWTMEYTSRGVFELSGYTQEDVINNKNISWNTIIHPNDRSYVFRLIQLAINQESPFKLEYRIVCADGKIKTVLEQGQGIFENNNIQALEGFITDVTEQKKNKIDLQKAKEKAEESDRLKSAFLANMSHEIRTPMNGILGFTSLLKEPDNTAEDVDSFVDVIERSGQRLLGIINDLIDISKIESGLMELRTSQVDINKQLNYLHTFFSPEVEAKKMLLVSNIQKNNHLLETDNEKFIAILTNILKNSIKYSNEGVIEFGYTEKHKRLEFYVKDQGIGIADQKHKSIFDRFVQADNTLASSFEGAGLGLSITKAFVELLGGEIWLESEVDVGSTFYFTLPI